MDRWKNQDEEAHIMSGTQVHSQIHDLSLDFHHTDWIEMSRSSQAVLSWDDALMQYLDHSYDTEACGVIQHEILPAEYKI